MPDTTVLDNPIWNALLTEHAALALGDGRARRYPAAIGPLAGMLDTSAVSYEALRNLAGKGGIVGLFLQDRPAPPTGWKMLRDGSMYQMICLATELPEPAALAPGAEIVRLTAADVPAMVELAQLTEPGPFNDRTPELGKFFGIPWNGRLVAMAGERLRLPEFVEVSAVCTHPEARGRGYGSALTATVARHIRSNGRTPILHLFAANQGAFRVYSSLGFAVRRTFELAVMQNEL
jgi:ribosomal protein S18 acetylase RimI-like enzyme